MKTLPDKVAGLALAAAFLLAPGVLTAQKTKDFYYGIRAGLSLFDASSVDQQSYPGTYPCRPVFGIFITDTEYIEDEDSPFSATGMLEVFYLTQSSFYDYFLRDDLGNIVAAYDGECRRQSLQVDFLGKILITRLGRATLAFLVGPALTIPLKTSKSPEVEDELHPEYKRAILSGVIGAGLEFKTGRLLLSFDVRYDLGFDTLSWARLDPKPDALLFIAGVGF